MIDIIHTENLSNSENSFCQNFSILSHCAATRNVSETVSFETRSIIRSMINELNNAVSGILTSCEQKEIDKASLLILQTLDTTAKKTSENTEVCKRLTDQVGKLSSFVYKIQYEQCQKQLKLWDMEQNIAKDITDYRTQASRIFSEIKSMFNDNDLNLPKSTSSKRPKQEKGVLYFGTLFKLFRGKNL